MPQRLNQEQWQTVLELSQAAAELPSHERSAFLESAGSSAEIMREVLALLAESEPSPGGGIRIGERIGRFVITGNLSRGGMGEVYSARDTELGRVVALKFLTPEMLGLHGAIEKFIREAQTASALNHPNIVTIHEVLRHESNVAIVMELVEGITLRALRATPVPWREGLKIGQQVCQALAAAHAQGIIHRDIKPENIILRPDGCVKLLDFGLARTIAPQERGLNWTSHPGLLAGTWRYMSPEQARGEKVTAATDIFSLGIVLYELCSGKHPFDAEDAFETLHAIVTAEADSLSARAPGVPYSLDSLVHAMLAKQPSERPSAQEVASKLGEILSPAASIPARRQRRRVWIAVLALVLLAAGASFLIIRKTPQQFTNWRIEPLTSQAGWESNPALSPDGQSVAFTWTDRLDGQKQLYVKRLNESEPIRLTSSESAGQIGSVVWSPDGKRIAFKRQSGIPGGIYSIKSTGGDEQKILDLVNANLSSSIDWSPDGTQLAFSDSSPGQGHLAIYVYNLRTGEKRRLTSPPADNWGDWDPTFSPDGARVAFKRVAGFWADDIYLAPEGGGIARRITNMATGIWGHAWTADGESLIVSCQRSSTIFGIWLFPLNAQRGPQVISQGGTDAITPTAARKSNRISWVNQLWDLNIYRVSAAGLNPPRKLIASTARDQGADYSPDGKRIAFVSDRSGSREIWLGTADGERQTRVTNFNGPPLGNPKWSPDGRYLAFDSRARGRAEIFIVDCSLRFQSCEAPKLLQTGIPAEAPNWSADGQFIYFASGQTGTWELWKASVHGGNPIQVTNHGAYVGHESPQGKWLYFARVLGAGILRMPCCNPSGDSSSQEEWVVGPPYKPQPDGWAVTSKEIFFIDQATGGQPASIRAYDLSSKNVRSILKLTELFADRNDIGLSVSPDARWILYSQLDRSGSNIVVAESTH